MNKFIKPIMIASAIYASSAAITSTANAQVSNIGVVSPELAIANAKALTTAYQQIETQYKAQLDEITGRETNIQNFRKQLDTNNDNQVSAAEQQANAAVVQQIRAESNAIDEMSVPIALAQMFAIQQISAQYPTAQQQVVTEKQINMLLAPQSILYSSPSVDLDKEIQSLSQDVITKLDVLVPFVNINVPQGWQPDRNTQAVYQQIQQLRLAAARRAQQAAAQQAAPAPAQQPTGR